MRDRLRIVAEGVAAVHGEMDRRFEAVHDEFVSVRAEMAAGFAAVHGGFGDLGLRVERLERAS